MSACVCSSQTRVEMEERQLVTDTRGGNGKRLRCSVRLRCQCQGFFQPSSEHKATGGFKGSRLPAYSVSKYPHHLPRQKFITRLGIPQANQIRPTTHTHTFCAKAGPSAYTVRIYFSKGAFASRRSIAPDWLSCTLICCYNLRLPYQNIFNFHSIPTWSKSMPSPLLASSH